MGRSQRPRPTRLGQKLKLIRTKLGLTQAEMVEKLGVKNEPVYAASISQYERGLREPSLIVILRYARLAGVPMETLVDDKLRLRPRH